METLLIAIDYRDPAWIAIAFAFGLLCRQIKLPPMVGFLIAGFILHVMGAEGDDFLRKIADLGVTLLLFTIGLKLRIANLLKPEIWASTTIHMGISIVVTGALLMMLSIGGVLMFDGMDISTALIVAFALSFSSTVFAVKTMEDRGALTSRYGQIAIGVLVMQDIAAVLFLAVSSGKVPSPWALALLMLIPGRHFLGKLMEWAGHKELLAVFGFVMALGGAAVFEMVGMKGDLGALIFGLLLASHHKGSELAHTLIGFKDVFLVCFFLTIGLTGLPTWETAGAALILLLLIPFKTALFFKLFTKLKVRARSSTLAALSLGNYSEFGLIVAAIAIGAGWLGNEWLTVIALTLSASFVIASPFNAFADKIYAKYRHHLKKHEGKGRLSGDEDIALKGNKIMVFGMGRVGCAAYDQMDAMVDGQILGIDQDDREVMRQVENGRNVLRGDATNPEFWSRMEESQSDINLILLAMPNPKANRQAAKQLRERGYEGPIVATAKFHEDVPKLEAAGIDRVYNIYAEAGTGAANHMREFLTPDETIERRARNSGM
ncbi:cation:proton antiporter family protein [Terasakiella sp. A23]|uniref:cation:proton antiporter family protein n=1 Tax=Terasakiella sp. FCG-A23 TaxID=3080561 RepID=UPI0029531BAB|nr:cation:proton antiporter family protein [Terasakiella sp. A23]MDV7340057.1 cation:proton antiporter family protein [Terasakiella sp. A23]